MSAETFVDSIGGQWVAQRSNAQDLGHNSLGDDIGSKGRDPALIMTPETMSAFKASRLSFLRYVIRRMVCQRWRIAPTRFELDERGRGTATRSNAFSRSAILPTAKCVPTS